MSGQDGRAGIPALGVLAETPEDRARRPGAPASGSAQVTSCGPGWGGQAAGDGGALAGPGGDGQGAAVRGQPVRHALQAGTVAGGGGQEAGAVVADRE